MASSDYFVSVIAPLYDDAPLVADFVREVIEVLAASYTNYELVLIDDGSRDGTAAAVLPCLTRYKCLRLIRLTRHFGTEVALAAGLDAVIGDFVVLMDPATDPPGLIPEMIDRCRAGKGIVFGVKRGPGPTPEPAWVRAGGHLLRRVARRLFRVTLPDDSSVFRALSRQAVNALTQIRDKYRHLHLMSAYVGYDTEQFFYTEIGRRNPPRRRGLGDKLDRVIDIILSNSPHPLRVVTWLGLFAGLLNALYVVYVVLVFLFKDRVVEGWTTLSLQTAGMFFLVFLTLTVLSEYVGRILVELRDRPLYYVLEELHSSVVVADQDRRNVVHESRDPAVLAGGRPSGAAVDRGDAEGRGR